MKQDPIFYTFDILITFDIYIYYVQLSTEMIYFVIYVRVIIGISKIALKT